MPVNRKQVAEEAQSWKDVKWRHQGRSREHGIDCAGLVIRVAQDLNLSEFEITAYQRDAHDNAFVRYFRENMVEKPIAERQEGDVVLMRQKMFSCHCGILTEVKGMLHVVHAFASRRKVVEEPLTDEILNRCTYCFEFGKVED